MRWSLGTVRAGGGVLLALAAGGCAINVMQTAPPPVRDITDIAREEPGKIVTVRDTRIDLASGRVAPLRTQTPRIGVGPLAVSVPVTIGGERKGQVPAEEMTIELAGGKLISVVQPLGSPPFAPGERVRVQYERVDDPRMAARVQVVRD